MYRTYNFKDRQGLDYKIEPENEIESKNETKFLLQRILEIVETDSEISDRDREIFYRYFEQKNFEHTTLKEIAPEYNLWPESIRQINLKVCKKLLRKLEKEDWGS